MSLHDARGIHERHIQETQFQVCKVQGKSLYNNIFAHGDSDVCRFYRQNVHEGERERVAHPQPIQRNRVLHGNCQDHVRHDEVVFDHRHDLPSTVFRYSHFP